MLNSKEHINYLKRLKKNKRKIVIIQILILVLFLIIWEVLSRLNIINSFLSSSPTNVLKTIITLLKDKSLFTHAGITIYETIISFSISTIIGFMIASIMWFYNSIAKVLDPYLTILNSLPKVALGPLIIIWVGASINSIIFMALLITIFVTIINIYESFQQTNKSYILLLK